MSGWQIEDNLWAECVRVARGRPPGTDFWTRSQSFRAAEERGGSGNWPWMACGVAAKLGQQSAINNVRDGTDQPHDFDLVEPYVDDEHARFILVGKTLCRDGFAFGPRRDPALATRLGDELRQFWASLLLCSTSPDDLARNMIVRPGARSSAPKTARHRLEYLLLRADGWSEQQIRRGAVDGRKIVKAGNRVDANQEYSTAEAFTALETSFRADWDAVHAAFLRGGWPALAEFFVVGTRVPFEWARFADGSFAAVMERNCNGNNGPRWWVAWQPRERVPGQFPTRPVPRQQTEQGWARLDLDRRIVVAQAESSGRGERTISPAAVALHLRSDDSGCRVLSGLAAPPPAEPPAPPPAPPPRPKKKRPWWKFW